MFNHNNGLWCLGMRLDRAIPRGSQRQNKHRWIRDLRDLCLWKAKHFTRSHCSNSGKNSIMSRYMRKTSHDARIFIMHCIANRHHACLKILKRNWLPINRSTFVLAISKPVLFAPSINMPTSVRMILLAEWSINTHQRTKGESRLRITLKTGKSAP